MARFLLTLIPVPLLLLSFGLHAQSVVEGLVIDRETGIPMAGVAVTNWKYQTGVFTDAKGRYQLTTANPDSLRFSYLGKKGQKMVVNGGWKTHYVFNISLEDEPHTSHEVLVTALKKEKSDSLANREFNAAIFTYKNPKVHTSLLGVNIESAYERYVDPHYKRLRKFKTQSLKEEKHRYVYRYFNPVTIRNLCGFSGEKLDYFFKNYYPTYSSLSGKTEYEIDEYIIRLANKYECSKR